MKRLYLVRHGESEANVTRTYGVHSTPLTETGRAQAGYIAERCVSLPIQKLVASSMSRAKDTAEAISHKLQLQYEVTDLFVECGVPSMMSGQTYDKPDVFTAAQEIRKNFGPGYRFSDEENFDDLKARAKAALAFAASQPEDHVLVVAHGMFIRVLLAYAVFGELLTEGELTRFMWGFENQNTGITILDYAAQNYMGETMDNPWRVWVYNDHAHLAE